MAPLTEKQLLERLGRHELVENADQMSERYMEGIKRIMTVSADTELVSAPAYYKAVHDAPSTNALISAMGIIQDELGHAHIAYRIMEDIGVDKEELIYERQPHEFKYPYAFDVPLDTWVELVVANGFYDRAGFVLLADVFKHTTFGPWKRALVKVDKEENFHLRHGETWMRKINASAEGHGLLQRAIDWMFPLVVEWFGLPDKLKKHNVQIEYGFKGSTNDELRQIWMSTAVPLAEELGLDVPAHFDSQKNEFVLEYPFPSAFDAEEKLWLFDEGEVTWDDVLSRWKARGPQNQEFVDMLQRGHKQVREMLLRDNGNGHHA